MYEWPRESRGVTQNKVAEVAIHKKTTTSTRKVSESDRIVVPSVRASPLGSFSLSLCWSGGLYVLYKRVSPFTQT